MASEKLQLQAGPPLVPTNSTGAAMNSGLAMTRQRQGNMPQQIQQRPQIPPQQPQPPQVSPPAQQFPDARGSQGTMGPQVIRNPSAGQAPNLSLEGQMPGQRIDYRDAQQAQRGGPGAVAPPAQTGGGQIGPGPQQGQRGGPGAPPPGQTISVGGQPMQGATPEDGRTTQQMIEDWLRDQFGGPRDTSAEEDLIRQQFEDKLGRDIVNQRAGMGRAGFASSGALSAMEGDMRRSSRQSMLDAIFGVQQGARDEELARASRAGDMSFRAEEQAQRQAMLDAALQMLTDEDPADAPRESRRGQFPEGEEGDAQYADYIQRSYGRNGPVGPGDPGGNIFNAIPIDAAEASAVIRQLGLEPAFGPAGMAGLMLDQYGNIYKVQA